jgi:hypothetical protein
MVGIMLHLLLGGMVQQSDLPDASHQDDHRHHAHHEDGSALSYRTF